MQEDRDLIIKLRDAKTRDEAFGELIQAYQEPLYFHIRRMVGNHQDADDVLQNTFVKVWRHLDSFKGDSKLYTWMYRIASNEALNHIQKANRGKTTTLEDYHHPSTAHQERDSGEIQEKLEAALATLPPKQKQVFDLKYFEDMKYEDIAEITGTSVGALKASYFHAVKKIEGFLTED